MWGFFKIYFTIEKKQDHKTGAVQPGEGKVALRPHHNLRVFETAQLHPKR